MVRLGYVTLRCYVRVGILRFVILPRVNSRYQYKFFVDLPGVTFDRNECVFMSYWPIQVRRIVSFQCQWQVKEQDAAHGDVLAHRWPREPAHRGVDTRAGVFVDVFLPAPRRRRQPTARRQAGTSDEQGGPERGRCDPRSD